MKTKTPINILLVIMLLVSTSFFIPTALSIPTNKVPCNSCHGVGGQGTLSTTNLDGSRPANNNFITGPGESISISLQALGANKDSTPAVALVFNNQIFHHISIEGASPGGQGSFAFYVMDGDENDQNSEPGQVKGVFQISIDEDGEPGIYETVATFIQEGPSGITVGLNLIIEGVSRETSSISILVSPTTIYANKDRVFISGSIRPSDAEQVTIEYKTEDIWQVIDVISPSTDGLFFYEWNPEMIEDYSIKVHFEGNENYAAVESDIFEIKVLKSQETLNTEILTSVLLAMGAMLLFSALFYTGGRKRYNKRIALKVNIK